MNSSRQLAQLIENEVDRSNSYSLANFLMVRKESLQSAVQHQFKADLQSLYHAKVSEIDFITKGEEAKSEANTWVRSATKGGSRMILDSPPSPDTRAVLLNAVHFRAKWRTPFPRSATEKRTFYSRGVNASQTDFVSHSQQLLAHRQLQINGQSVQALELPYANDSLSMVLLLPDRRTGLQAILADTNRSRNDLLFALEAVREMNETRAISLQVPKFKVEANLSLQPALEALGVTDIFNSNVADLSGMNGLRNLYVSLIKQRGDVRFDEEGTMEGAAAAPAAAGNSTVTLPSVPSISFVADHPFLFLIRDKGSGLVLFIGKLEGL